MRNDRIGSLNCYDYFFGGDGLRIKQIPLFLLIILLTSCLYGCGNKSDALAVSVDNTVSYHAEQLELDYDFGLTGAQDATLVGVSDSSIYFAESIWDEQPLTEVLYAYDMDSQTMQVLYRFPAELDYALMEVKELDGAVYCSGFYHNDQSRYGIYMLTDGELLLIADGEIKTLDNTPELTVYEDSILFLDASYNAALDDGTIGYEYRINIIRNGIVEVLYETKQTQDENTQYANTNSLMANGDDFVYVIKQSNGENSNVIVYRDFSLYKQFSFSESVGDTAVMGDSLLVQYGYVVGEQTKIELALIDLQTDERTDTENFSNRLYNLKTLGDQLTFAVAVKDLTDSSDVSHLYIPYLLTVENQTIHATKMDDLVLSDGVIHAASIDENRFVTYNYGTNGENSPFCINLITLD